MNAEPDEFDFSDPSELPTSDLLAALVRAGVRTNELLEERIAPALERIAAALERGPALAGPAPAPPDSAATLANLRARLEASRSANDPDSVMALRDQMADQMAAEDLAELDRDVARWLVRVIQRRMRAGTVRVDVVALAGRVADRFGTIAEGASLRASLPTLRRSAGLCASCGEPYTGIEDVCPRCEARRRLAEQAAADAAAAPPASDPPEAGD